MHPSILKTLAVPAVGSADQPATLHQAADRVVRVVIHNIGGCLVFLAHAVNDLNSSVSPSEVFQLGVDAELTLVLMPTQTILAASQGGGGRVSVAVSEALPKEWLAS